jgi:hypothetical protein
MAIVSKPTTKEYRNGWQRIYGSRTADPFIGHHDADGAYRENQNDSRAGWDSNADHSLQMSKVRDARIHTGPANRATRADKDIRARKDTSAQVRKMRVNARARATIDSFS